MTKEVRFDIYCKKCDFWATSASSDPCNSCLGDPCNEGSHVPRYFKQSKPLVNFLLPDPNVVCYTRDRLNSRNWVDAEPSDADLKQYFKKDDKGDWYEKEV